MFDFSNFDETIFQTNKTFRYSVLCTVVPIELWNRMKRECHAAQNHNGPFTPMSDQEYDDFFISFFQFMASLSLKASPSIQLQKQWKRQEN